MTTLRCRLGKVCVRVGSCPGLSLLGIGQAERFAPRDQHSSVQKLIQMLDKAGPTYFLFFFFFLGGFTWGALLFLCYATDPFGPFRGRQKLTRQASASGCCTFTIVHWLGQLDFFVA